MIEQTDQFQKYGKTLARKYEFEKIKKKPDFNKKVIFYIFSDDFSIVMIFRDFFQHCLSLLLLTQLVMLCMSVIIQIYVKKLHSLYKLCKGDIVVGDIKLQRSPLQNSNFVIILSVGFVLTLCNYEVGIL